MIEPLDPRLMLAVTASFSAAAGELRVTGDDQDNTIVVSRTPAGAILVNNGAVAIQGDVPTIANTNHFHIVAGAGNDVVTLDETNGRLPGAAIFGGAGNDTLTGGSGDDFIEGGTGNDTAFMGAGDDTFSWNPGDGSDIVNGQAGTDSLVFNGSDLAEQFTIADSGAGAPFHRARLTRDIGNVSMDLGTLEDIDLNPLGGADTITVNDQSATDLQSINLDLEGSTGLADGQADNVILNGSAGDDVANISSFINGGISAFASAFPLVNMIGADPTLDTLTINTLGGNDQIDASSLAPGLINLFLNGGAGNDLIFGSPGNDQITGGPGNDTAAMGAGDDTFIWNPGDGSDNIDGQAGTDTLVFNGSNADDNFGISPNGGGVQFSDVAGSVAIGGIDANDVEQAAVSPLGGANAVQVNDLTGTALTHLKVTLAADARPDSIALIGTNAPDAVAITGDFANGLSIAGLPAQIDVKGAMEAADSLSVNTLGGSDTINVAVDTPMSLAIDGFTQHDTINVTRTAPDGVVRILPSNGNDTVNVTPAPGDSANISFDASQHLSALTIAGPAATATITVPSSLTVDALSITGSGLLDLGNGLLFLDNTLTPEATVRQLLAAAYNRNPATGIGNWLGRGSITSSTAIASHNGANPNFKFSVGYVNGAYALDPLLGGSIPGQQFLPTNQILIRATPYGDFNLDGRVNDTDLSIFSGLGQFHQPTDRFGWLGGDLNYDNRVDDTDLQIFSGAGNFDAPPAPPAASAVKVAHRATRRQLFAL